MSNRRFQRLNELLRRHLSQKLIGEVKDPRIGFVTVLRASIYDDYSAADVFVSVLEEENSASTITTLNGMRGFFQNGLSKVLGTRITPNLRFKLDAAAASAVQIDALISKARLSDTDGGEGHQKAKGQSDDLEASQIEDR